MWPPGSWRTGSENPCAVGALRRLAAKARSLKPMRPITAKPKSRRLLRKARVAPIRPIAAPETSVPCCAYWESRKPVEVRPMEKFTEPGKWYLCVECSKCGEPIAFAEVASPEEEPGPFRYRTISDLKCPTCGHSDAYAPALMSRRMGPERS